MNIEEAKKILEKFTTEHKLFNIKHSDGLEEAIETLLTAYEKEKEKNKITKQMNENLIEVLKEDKYGLEEEVQMQAKNIMLCEEALCEMQDKIKAKIEYYEKIDNPVGKIVLQSLLEKE